jgi:hypothetical protein
MASNLPRTTMCVAYNSCIMISSRSAHWHAKLVRCKAGHRASSCHAAMLPCCHAAMCTPQHEQHCCALQRRQHQHAPPLCCLPCSTCCPYLSTLLRCRVLSIYLMWSIVVQLGCTLWVMYREGGDLKQLGMHMLALTANNTGIIGAHLALAAGAAAPAATLLQILQPAAPCYIKRPLAVCYVQHHYVLILQHACLSAGS